MEILVILMLAAVFFAITMFIVSFIMIKKHQIDKAYQNGSDDLYIEDDDDDEDESNNNFVSSESSNEVENKINEEKMVQDVKTETDVEHLELDSETKSNDFEEVIEPVGEVKSDFDENTLVDIIIPKVDNSDKEVVEESIETDLQEVVNVLINKKNYMFLANGNKVNKGEHIKLLLNKKIYYGLITKSNYMRDIKSLKNKPYKLIIIKNNKVKKEEIEVLDTSDLEFVPKRKVQN